MQISNGKLAEILSNILTNPGSGEVDDQEAFERFVNEITQVVCDFCGGEIVTPASYMPETDNMDWSTHYVVEVETNESSPDNGGVWATLPAESTSTTSQIPVKYWEDYGNEKQDASMTHSFDVDDQRKSGGQMFVDIGAIDGNVDDMLGVTMEINANPLNGIDHVPCAHIHFDGDNLAVSLFKIGSKILMRPETDVSINQVQEVAFGVAETMYWIE